MTSRALTLFFAQELLRLCRNRAAKIAYDKTRYLQNKVEKCAYQKNYHDAHRAEQLDYHKKYYADNLVERTAYQKSYYVEHKVEQASYRAKNKVEKAAYNKKYAAEHLAEKAERNKNRYNTDPNYRILAVLRSRVRKVLAGASKSARTAALLGCSPQECREHLEKQFQPWMTWDNYGEWEIDHIRPCASFNMLDPEQQHQCFHFSNLQPLRKIENFQKGAKYVPSN